MKKIPYFNRRLNTEERWNNLYCFLKNMCPKLISTHNSIENRNGNAWRPNDSIMEFRIYDYYFLITWNEQPGINTEKFMEFRTELNQIERGDEYDIFEKFNNWINNTFKDLRKKHEFEIFNSFTWKFISSYWIIFGYSIEFLKCLHKSVVKDNPTFFITSLIGFFSLLWQILF
jgi:hypothetical protein